MSNPPKAEIKFNKKAQVDIRGITGYLLGLIGPEQTLKTIQQINARFRYLAENPWIGDTIEGFSETVRLWYTRDKKYQIFSGVPVKIKLECYGYIGLIGDR